MSGRNRLIQLCANPSQHLNVKPKSKRRNLRLITRAALIQDRLRLNLNSARHIRGSPLKLITHRNPEANLTPLNPKSGAAPLAIGAKFIPS